VKLNQVDVSICLPDEILILGFYVSHSNINQCIEIFLL